MEDQSENLSLDQYYTSLRDFNQYSKPKMIESNLEEINKNIVKIQERLEELSGDTIFAGNDEVNGLILKLNDAKKYVQTSLIPATEKIKRLQELLEKRNQNNYNAGNSVNSNYQKEIVTASDNSFEYNPKFTNYLNASSSSSVDRLKSIHLSNLDVEIFSLINEIKKLAHYNFENHNDMFIAVQPLYGVYPGPTDQLVEVQPLYGVYPGPTDQLVEVQPLYGVYPGPTDQLVSVQPKYGVECPTIGSQIESVQPKYGVECPTIGSQIESVQPKYGVECPTIGSQIESVQPKYGVEYPTIGSQIESVQPKYGVEYPTIGSQITSVQPK